MMSDTDVQEPTAREDEGDRKGFPPGFRFRMEFVSNRGRAQELMDRQARDAEE